MHFVGKNQLLELSLFIVYNDRRNTGRNDKKIQNRHTQKKEVARKPENISPQEVLEKTFDVAQKISPLRPIELPDRQIALVFDPDPALLGKFSDKGAVRISVFALGLRIEGICIDQRRHPGTEIQNSGTNAVR